ncbi:MAG: hypothetical protein M3361_20485 [Candidatus Tectomicrobia bacterium]|nr:hypothetical protein [Candidatus Tectomicrobia bacterium]
MTLFSISPDKLIDGLMSLPKEKDLREGEFSFTLGEGERPELTLSLVIRALVREIPPMPERVPPHEAPTVRTYQTTSYFLRECHRQLFAGNPAYERQLLLSGASFPEDDRHILDINVPVKLANVSHTGVEADMSDLLRRLADLDVSHGLLLLGVFHSHLWKGRGAVNPSETDRAL